MTTLTDKLNEAIELANTSMKMYGGTFKDQFPYQSYMTMEDDKGRKYRVMVEIKPIKI